MAVTQDEVLQALRAVQDPDLGRDVVSLGFVKDLRIDGGRVAVTLELTTPACPVKDQLRAQAEDAIRALGGVSDVEVTMTSQVRTSIADPQGLLPSVKNIVPVASGKGGVGKSTASANLALALVQSGAAVGLLDADVYGPSIPMLLGITEAPQMDAQERMLPVVKDGLKVMSMAFFLPAEEAVVWRGPMLHKAVQQFLGGVVWGELDYLIIDLPPGTGDVQLSLCQSTPITGAVIVSTPQDVALNVAQKAIAMFKKLNAPILGILENMSYYECPHCRTREEIFGSGGARRIAERMGIPVLGAIPLATAVRTGSDAGRPIVLSDPDSAAARAFTDAAKQMAAQVSIRGLERQASGGIKINL
ncbi:MAG TPA: Mrp/NBP35 family ATP-binding protein [bacterium]